MSDRVFIVFRWDDPIAVFSSRDKAEGYISGQPYMYYREFNVDSND